ncbi:MAG: hypothetical protein ONB23_03850 [candidate division KSB1 bacterium]|nr:hypothetical protein [candidate division KSB1 bacterium]
MLKKLGGALLVLVGILVLANVGGSRRWKAKVASLTSRLESNRVHPLRPNAEWSELEFLPPPVQRYLRLVLPKRASIIACVRLKHAGTFNLGQEKARWVPFESDQRVVTRRPGFVWNARLRVFPALLIRVVDAYVAGQGLLEASLLGLVPIASQPPSKELSEGELLRFLAETPWYPTALLPGQGIVWTALDDRHALASLRDGELVAELVFEFGTDGLISSVRTDARYRFVQGKPVQTAWEGFFSHYDRVNGVLIPREGAVQWMIDGRPVPYWRARITEIEFEFVP